MLGWVTRVPKYTRIRISSAVGFPQGGRGQGQGGSWGRRECTAGALQCVSPTAWEVRGKAGTGL